MKFFSSRLPKQRVFFYKFPTPRHVSIFCLRVKDALTRIMTRVPSTVFKCPFTTDLGFLFLLERKIDLKRIICKY